MPWPNAWRYQRGRLIKSRKSKKDIQCGGEKLGDTKGVIKPVNRKRTDNAMAKSLEIPKG
jgi:hypothetical protein